MANITVDIKKKSIDIGSNLVAIGKWWMSPWVYDPQEIKADVFDMDNMVDWIDKHYLTTEQIEEFEGKQDALTAWDNIDITNNVISATDTTYTAWDWISIDENNVISNTRVSAEWWNIEWDIEDQSDLQEALADKQDVISDLSEIRSNATAGKNASDTIATYWDIVTHDADEFATADSVGEWVLTIQKNSTTVDTFSANATENKTINITVPTQASDIGALPDTTKYAANLDLSINSSTYVITAQLKDQNWNNIGTQRTVDLPLESVVVDWEYDAENKKIILTLENGNKIEFSVADLVSWLQTEITVDNKLDADLVDDTTASHKFVTSTEKSCISTAVQPWDLATYAKCCDIPTDNSQLANGCWYTTCTWTLVPSDIQNLAQCCDVPTDNCQLWNGCGYITCEDLPDLSWYQLKCNMVCNLTDADDSHYPTAKAVADAMCCAWVWDMLEAVYDPCWCRTDTFDYCNLYNTPTIPTDNSQLANGCWFTTCTGTLVASDIANLAKCCDIPTDNSQLANGCWYTTCTGTLVQCDIANLAKCCDIPTDNCQLWNGCWYITWINCSDVTSALGYTPYNSTNPAGYTTCTWTLVQSDIANLAQCCDVPTDNCQLANGCGFATCCYVNDSINSVTAYYITKDAQWNQFATHAELSAATTFYSWWQVRVPTKNDYTIVLSDEDHDNATTRYIYNSSWEFQYVVNETALTQAQLDALNSWITCTKVSCYDNCMAKCCDIPTDNCQLANGCGYITGISCSDVTSALWYTPYNSTNPNWYTTCTGTITENDIATCDKFWVVKLWSDIPLDMGNVNKPSDEKERTYVVQNIWKAEQMAVNVPWTDTTYCACDFDIRCLSDACWCMNTWNCKQDTLTAWNNITINANTISGDFNYATSSTAAACTTKCVCIPEITQLCVWQQITVKPSVTATNCATSLKLNDFTAYPIRFNNAALTSTTDWYIRWADCLTTFLFDWSYWQVASKSYDINTTYSLNTLLDAWKHIAWTGTYALSRYSLVMEKNDWTWEKITNTSAAYSTATTKTVNTNWFRLNKIRYYNTTTNVANGALIATNTLANQAASVDLRYSTNCWWTTTWAEWDYIYLVGTIKADWLFYLDTTQWWTTTLPSTNDWKLYIRIWICLAANWYTASLLIDRPIFYYDNWLKIYQEADNKQDKISDLDTIRSWATCGATSVQPWDLACYAQCCDIPTDNCQLANGCWYTTCIGTVVASDIANLAQCCDIPDTSCFAKCCDIPTDNCQLNNGCGYIKWINCSDVTTALWYTPYNATNPCWYYKSWDCACLCCVNVGGASCHTKICCDWFISEDLNLGNCAKFTPIGISTYYWCFLFWEDWSGCGIARYCDIPDTSNLAQCCDIPTDNCQLSNSCGYTTCTGTLNWWDLKTINGCCLVWSWDICIQGWWIENLPWSPICILYKWTWDMCAYCCLGTYRSDTEYNVYE